MSKKYHSKRWTRWIKLYEIYLLATIVNPKERPDVNKLISSDQKRLEYHSLNCSQQTSLVDYSENIIRSETCPFSDNDGTNVCIFLCYKIASTFHFKLSDIVLEYPKLINQYRNISVPADALEVKSILEKVDSMVGEAELSEKINNNAHVFSNADIQSLIISIKSLGIHTFESAIYICSPYSFIISANQKQYCLVDTHSVLVNSNGNGNALVILSEDKSPYSVMQFVVWLLQQIARSSAGQIFHQSFTVINFKDKKL